MSVALFLCILNLNFLKEMVGKFEMRRIDTIATQIVATTTSKLSSSSKDVSNLPPMKVITIGRSIIPAPAGEGMPPLGDMPPMGDPNGPPPGGPMDGGPGPMDDGPGGPGPMDGGPDLGAINEAMDMETTDPMTGPDSGPGPMDEPPPDMPPPEDDGNVGM